VSPDSIGLSGFSLDAAFPFHIIVDRELCVQQVGRSLPKLWPALNNGARLGEFVRLERPVERLSWEMLASNSGTLFILACSECPLLMRGQVIVEGEHAVFLISPWLTEVAQLKSYGLSFKDFAIHDPILDLLQILQSQRVSVEELKQLTETLTKQRTELRKVNEQLQGQNVMLSEAKSALALQEQESRKLALIVAKAENAVVLTDRHGAVEWVNESFTKITGYTLDEMKGRTPGSVLQGADSDPSVAAQLRKAIRERRSYSCEILNYRKDGRKYWVAIDLQPMFSVNGELTNFVAIESDVTLRRAAAARLALQLGVSTILARSVSQKETIPAILEELLLRLGWRFASFWRVNEVAAKARCEHMTEPKGEQFADFVSMTAAAEFGPDEGLPGRVWKSGRAHWVRDVGLDDNFPRAAVALIGGMRGALAFPVRAGGAVIGVIECFSADVEPLDAELLKVLESVGGQLGQFIERGNAAAALRAAETRLRTLVEQLPAVTYIAEAGEKGRWHYVSPQIMNLVGYSPAEWMKDPSLYLRSLHPDDVDRVLALEKDAAENRRHYSQVYRFIARDGRTVWCNDLATPVVDEASGRTVLQGVVFDITESQNAQVVLSERSEELSIANASLAKASRLKDEFLASMSHELRTPLNAVMGLSEALQENVFGALNDKQASALKNIEESGRHLLELINDILDLSKIEAGHLVLETTAIDLEPVCQASIRLIRETATRKRLRISTSFDAGQVVVNADERRLKQILVNLLSNAVKFTPEGGRIGVEVECNPENKTVSIVVWDTGIGIAKENMERLFKPFVQLDSSLSRQYSGTGLGLSLVRRMAELMNGTVEVQSEVNKGSRFTVTLPLISGTKLAVPSEAAPVADGKRVESALVIEDSADAANIIERYLTELGTKVFTDLTGEDAMELAIANGVQMIFLDLHLPHRSGWEILEKLHNDPRTAQIPVVIVSVEDPPSAPSPQYADYIVKPLRRERLLKAIEKASPIEAPGAALVVSGVARRKRVLLAEDNETNVLTLTGYLTAKGYDLLFARNGMEAIHVAEAHRPDLILMDIQMPVMNGMEAMEALKRDAALARIPVIALTSLAMPGDREKCMAAGARAYISKPVSLRSLAQTMEIILAGK
jgi:PAS domain S-box-containing protein